MNMGSFPPWALMKAIYLFDGKLLILSNGAYGERQEDIAKHAGLKYRIQHFHYNEVPDAAVVKQILDEDKEITHVSMVHSETVPTLNCSNSGHCFMLSAAILTA